MKQRDDIVVVGSTPELDDAFDYDLHGFYAEASEGALSGFASSADEADVGSSMQLFSFSQSSTQGNGVTADPAKTE